MPDPLKPNIVFVHVDQMSYDAMSVRGNTDVHTPHLDRIAAEGTSFLLAHSANPVCCPARSSWYTGRMSSEHGVVRNAKPILDDLPDLGRWMQPRGYDCFYTGKWHVPHRKVGDSFRMLPAGHHYGELGDAAVATAACGFLQHYSGSRPFFLNAGFLNPHDCCYLSFSPQNPATKFQVAGALREELPPLPPNFDPNAQKKGSSDKCVLFLVQGHELELVEFHVPIAVRLPLHGLCFVVQPLQGAV